MPKLFIFDRDDTLIDKNEKLINKERILSIISAILKEEGIVNISQEAIYQHIWKNKRIAGTLYTHLRHHGKKIMSALPVRLGAVVFQIGWIFDERPSIVAEKTRIGDWEGDTIPLALLCTTLMLANAKNKCVYFAN